MPNMKNNSVHAARQREYAGDADGTGWPGKDKLLACQLDAILHAEAFQELEAVWRGLHYLVFNTETSDRLKLRLFNASFKELRTDLERAVEFDQSLLFKRVYEEEYGTFGGEPYSCLLHVHEYGLSAVDLGVLQKMAEVAAAAHTPLLSAASPQLSGWGASPICPCHAICTRFSRARTISNGVRSARRTIPAM